MKLGIRLLHKIGLSFTLLLAVVCFLPPSSSAAASLRPVGHSSSSVRRSRSVGVLSAPPAAEFSSAASVLGASRDHFSAAARPGFRLWTSRSSAALRAALPPFSPGWIALRRDFPAAVSLLLRVSAQANGPRAPPYLLFL